MMVVFSGSIYPYYHHSSSTSYSPLPAILLLLTPPLLLLLTRMMPFFGVNVVNAPRELQHSNWAPSISKMGIRHVDKGYTYGP